MEKLINGFKIEENMKIEFVKNPKRNGFKGFERYEKYQTATTLNEYYELSEKKYSNADLRYDEEHKFLKIFNENGDQINLIED